MDRILPTAGPGPNGGGLTGEVQTAESIRMLPANLC